MIPRNKELLLATLTVIILLTGTICLVMNCTIAGLGLLTVAFSFALYKIMKQIDEEEQQ